MQQGSPILGIYSKSDEGFEELKEIFNGVRDMGMKINWNTDFYDALMFLVEKNEGIVIEKNEHKKIEFIDWVHLHVRQRGRNRDALIHWGYKLLKVVQGV